MVMSAPVSFPDDLSRTNATNVSLPALCVCFLDENPDEHPHLISKARYTLSKNECL